MVDVLERVLYKTFTGESLNILRETPQSTLGKSLLEVANFSPRFIKAKTDEPLIVIKKINLEDDESNK